MSVEHGGGSTEDQRTGEHARESGRHVFAHLYESYAASLFDYCDGLLRDTLAAVDAVQDSLVAVDAEIGSTPEPDRLRLSLYSAARRECLGQLPGARTKLSSRAETTTLDELGAAVPDYEVAGPVGETVLILSAALDRLSDRDREVLNLAFRHRFNDTDLGAVIGVSSRRARTLLSEASVRFDQSAPVIAVLRAAIREGRPRCKELAGIIRRRDLATFPLTPQFCSKVARHLQSCAECALSRGDRELRAEQISEIPLAIPPGRLRLRISRTALALGSYRRTVASRPDKPDRPRKGDQPVPLRPRRGVPKVMAVSSVTLVALAVPTAILYRMTATPAHTPRASAEKTVMAGRSPNAATTTAVSPELDTPAGPQRHHRHHPPLPGTLTPAHLGELPAPLTGPGHAPNPLGSGSPGPGPAGSSAPPTTSAPTTSAPTTSAPTPTPAPTTPAPTPTPAPTTPAPTPTPTATT